MEQAIQEKRRSKRGIELPIECYRRQAFQGRKEHVQTPHYHEHIELLYADGECDMNVWIGGEDIRIVTGDLLIINSGVAHTFSYNVQKSEYICVKVLPSILYSPENSFLDMKYILPFFRERSVNSHVFRAEETKGQSVSNAFSNILSECEKKAYGYEIAVRGEILSIFLWVVRNRSGDSKGSEDTRTASGYNEALIQRSVEYISANLAEATESGAADFVNMSRSHYSRQFKVVIGKSFCEYVNILKIGEAEKLLLTTDTSVTDIAHLCGFATSSHFIEHFKRQKGTTPGRYRQIWIKRKISLE